MTEIELTHDERKILDSTIYRIFPRIVGYDAWLLDAAVAEIVAGRLNELADSRE